jgi:sugar porter (SP) family MFS transporter
MATASERLTEPRENIPFIIMISCIAAIGGFLFGYDSGVINGTVDGLKLAFNSDSIGTGFNVASMLLGCAVGAFFAGRLADIHGRKSMLLVAAVLFIISAFGSGIANSSGEFIVYRILGGLAVGAASVMAPAYISEVSLARFRGRMTTIQQIAIIAGLFLSFLSNYFLAQSAGASTQVLWLGFEAWRWMFWMELIPAVIFFIALLLVPESPRFLVAKGSRDSAISVLARLYGESQGANKLQEITQSLSSEHAPRFSDLLDKFGRVRPIVWVGIGLASFQQLVGINVIFYYGAVLWQAVGFTESDALLINVLSGALSIVACLIAIALIDKLGRRPLLLIGSVGMTCTLLLATLAFSSATVTDGNLQLSGAMGILALIAANAYVFFFNFSWGPVMWVLLGEMFPNQIRGSGLAVAGLFQWGTNFLITMTFPVLLASIGLASAYGIYAAFAAISIIFVIKFVRETKGMELEDMEELHQRSPVDEAKTALV